MKITYSHEQNAHTYLGPEIALPLMLNKLPNSLLDIGCGTGTWMQASVKNGISTVFGVDGIEVDKPHYEKDQFLKVDFTEEWNLGRLFDVALCLEVAEHIDCKHAELFIQCITKHSSTIYFSAACPRQIGQHHVNCEWPEYWQSLFNNQGYVCSDSIRWKIWGDDRIEPWYRQNLFIAKYNPELAGKEPKLQSCVHPEMIDLLFVEKGNCLIKNNVTLIERGSMSLRWYVKVFLTACIYKINRSISRVIRF